ncbi:hypothetical protein BB558_003215 [Smittium angustum]|uniref:PHD-type domain-containing protein n=1 Tax=Smittium angustum TaxID=133377 RepID=A0A2U1J6N5_SMIAN|nr:hypothetical protein BB558_003215 [Smittium angustum]
MDKLSPKLLPNPQNSSASPSKKPQIEPIILISHLLSKLNHVQGIFDSFINDSSKPLALIKPHFNPKLRPIPPAPIHEKIINDVFLTPPQNSSLFSTALAPKQNRPPRNSASPFLNPPFEKEHLEKSDPILKDSDLFYEQNELLSELNETIDWPPQPPKNSYPPNHPHTINNNYSLRTNYPPPSQDPLINNIASHPKSNSNQLSLSQFIASIQKHNHSDNEDDTVSQATVCGDDNSDWEDFGHIQLKNSKTDFDSTDTSNFGSSPQHFPFPSNSVDQLSPDTNTLQQNTEEEYGGKTPNHYTHHHIRKQTKNPNTINRKTVFQEFTKLGIDWCRYCGTTEGINWRPGPWGKRTLCNKHGCDYKGYGFASKTPRLDLRSFIGEPVDERNMPILQTYCYVCLKDTYDDENPLLYCDGCPNSYHKNCLCETEIKEPLNTPKFFCTENCSRTCTTKKIVVELQKRKLPFMCSPSSVYAKSETNKKISTPQKLEKPKHSTLTQNENDINNHSISKKRHASTSEEIDSSRKRKSSRSLKPTTKGLESGIFAQK